MQKTKKTAIGTDSILVDTIDLCSKLRCGRKTAIDIGERAAARVQINRRVLWNLGKVQKYVESISE